MTTKEKSEAVKFMEEITGGPLTFARVIRSNRLCEEMTLEEFSALLGISKSHLCDIEKGRKSVSPERAYNFAKILGTSPERYVTLAVQAMLDNAGIDMKVEVA